MKVCGSGILDKPGMLFGRRGGALGSFPWLEDGLGFRF